MAGCFEEKKKKEISYFGIPWWLESLGGEEVVRVDSILVDCCPHNVQEEERNTAEDQEAFVYKEKYN